MVVGGGGVGAGLWGCTAVALGISELQDVWLSDGPHKPFRILCRKSKGQKTALAAQLPVALPETRYMDMVLVLNLCPKMHKLRKSNLQETKSNPKNNPPNTRRSLRHQ